MSNQTLHPTVKKLLIVDDHVLFREGLIGLFRATEDFDVVGGAGSVHEGITMARDLKPDIILMDFLMPDGTGLDATKPILSFIPDCEIVFLTVHDKDENLLAALRAGAKGYMLKNVPSVNLISSLRALSREEIAMSRKMMGRALGEFSRAQPRDGRSGQLSKLSPREMDVLRELTGGASNREVARRLFLSENTVKHHIRSLLEKLGVENRREARQIAIQHGLESKFFNKTNSK